MEALVEEALQKYVMCRNVILSGCLRFPHTFPNFLFHSVSTILSHHCDFPTLRPQTNINVIVVARFILSFLSPELRFSNVHLKVLEL